MADDAMDAWGEFDDDGDNFFDASATKAANPSPAAAAFDDGGEPDFAGWLAAQSKSKAGPRALPKGLGKTTNGTSLAARPTTTRSISSGPPAGTSKKVVPVVVKKPAPAPVKKVDLKPKDSEPTEDDWGAWD